MNAWAFDLDGTLVDSFSHYFSALERIFDHVGARDGARFSSDLHHAALTEPLTELFERHLGADRVTPALELLQQLSEEDAARIRPFTGAAELLDALRDRGERVAVWTNRDRVSASLILEATGLSTRVETLVSGTCVIDRKPHPEGLLRIAQELGTPPERITMVGDHVYDVLGAKSAGSRSVRASWHGYWLEQACEHADFQFHDFAEFSRWARS